MSFQLRRVQLSLLALVVLAANVSLAPAGKAADAPGRAPANSPVNPRYTGSPYIRTWLADDYGAHPENYFVLQHPRTGLIYVGNASGVLEFDGVRWRLIPIPGGGAAVALCVDARGRVWGCGGGMIFRLEPDARGELQARAMLDRLPADFRTPTLTASALTSSTGVYFRDHRNLLFFPLDDGPARGWRAAAGNVVTLRAWTIADEPYLMIGGNVILRLRHEKLERVPSLANTVWAARERPDHTWDLLSVRTVEHWAGEKITTLQQPIEANDGAQQATFLADGRMVFATVRSGLVVCDRDGRRLQKIDRAKGLPANLINAICEDREGGVWAAFSNGLARVQLDSPYARHGPPQGLEGTIHSLTKQDGVLFTGGTEGVTRRLPDGRFQPVLNIPGPDREIVAHDGWLYSLSYRLRGVQPARSNEARELENRNYYGLVPLAAFPGWYAHGSNEGLRWAHFAGENWMSEGPSTTVRGRTTALLESPAGVVWAARAGGAWRVDFRAGLRADAPARRFSTAEGMPTAPTAMFMFGGDLLALASGKLLRFDEAAARFEPATRLTGLEEFAIERVHVSTDGTLWLQGAPPAREIRRIVQNNRAPLARWRSEALASEPLRHLLPTTLFHEVATQTLWIGGHGALISCDLSWRPNRKVEPPAAIVRRIETAAGQLVMAGDGSARDLHLPALDAGQNALRIAFAAPTFVADRTGVVYTQYRTRLDGLDRDWSAWSKQTERDFTNLPWRAFTLRVQARDDAGRAGPETAIAFSIMPAWWATRWAWAGYGALGLLGLAGVVRLRTRALQHRAERLAAVVRDRTRELADSNAQLAASNSELARLHKLELDEKIAAQLSEEKARLEVLRYQLNPHFLYNSLNSIYGLLFENARDAGEMVLRLSDFCRATLTGAKDELPTLQSEIAALQSYLDVEKVRWSEKLQIEIDLAPDVADVRVPPFLLLPLVENAIKYGSRTSPGVLRLKIRAFRVNSGDDTRAAGPVNGHTARSSSRISVPDDVPAALVIEIANTGAWLPPDPSRPDSTGIGLENLRQRLRRYYPDAHAFSTEAKDGWVVARLLITDRPAISVASAK